MEPATSDLPFKRLIMVESPYIDQTSLEPINKLYKLIKASNTRRRTSWPSVEDAMQWMTSRPPWKVFHSDVLQIISVSYL
jgi:hypothetical protein